MEGPTILSKVPESVEERKVCFCSETAVAHCTAKLHSKATQMEGEYSRSDWFCTGFSRTF